MMDWILNFIFGPKCPLCGTRNMYPTNCGCYWCDFCFTEFTPREEKLPSDS